MTGQQQRGPSPDEGGGWAAPVLCALRGEEQFVEPADGAVRGGVRQPWNSWSCNEARRLMTAPYVRHDSSGPTHPHHQVRWAAEAVRPPSGRLPPPVGNATSRRFLPASSVPHLPGQPSSSARQKETHPTSRPVRTAHPLSANCSLHLDGISKRRQVPPPPPPPIPRESTLRARDESRDFARFPTAIAWRSPNFARRPPPWAHRRPSAPTIPHSRPRSPRADIAPAQRPSPDRIATNHFPPADEALPAS